MINSIKKFFVLLLLSIAIVIPNSIIAGPITITDMTPFPQTVGINTESEGTYKVTAISGQTIVFKNDLPSGVQQVAVAEGCDSKTKMSSAGCVVKLKFNAKNLGVVKPKIVACVDRLRVCTEHNITVQVVAETELKAIKITPNNPTVAKGVSQQFKAVGIYAGNATKDITDQVTWKSSKTSIADIDSKGIVTTKVVGNTDITAEFKGVQSEKQTLTVISSKLLSIAIDADYLSAPIGVDAKFKAIGTYSDHSTRNITSQVTWSSSDASIAVVDGNGVVTTKAAGTADIIATFNMNSSNVASALKAVISSQKITVTGSKIVAIWVDADYESVPIGFEIQFTATGIYDDDSEIDLTNKVIWKSSDSSMAINAKGLATSKAAGTPSITATFGKMSDIMPLSVTDATLSSIKIITADSVLPIGYKKQFTAIGLWSDGSEYDITTQVNWVSSDLSIATVDSSGMVMILKDGKVSITCAPKIVVTLLKPLKSLLRNNITDPNSGAVDVTGTTATLTSLVVTPPNSEMMKGETQKFTATGIYSDGANYDVSDQVSWDSNSDSIVIDENGVATAIEDGDADITATIGDEEDSNAVGKKISSGNIKVASGIVSATTTSTVSSATVQEILIISPVATNQSVPKDFKLQFTALGRYSDGSTKDITTQVIWLSKDASVAMVGVRDGKVTAMKAGNTTIIARNINSGLDASIKFTVDTRNIESIILQSQVSVPVGIKGQLVAYATYDDGSIYNITSQVKWSSTDAKVATIDNDTNKGFVATVGSGIATIGAELSGKSAGMILTVTEATLKGIDIMLGISEAMNLPAGMKIPALARGVYSDGSVLDLTSQVKWTSSRPAVAIVDDKGVITTVHEGVTNIGAFFGSVYSSKDLVFMDEPFKEIDVSLGIANVTSKIVSSVPVGFKLAASITAPTTYQGQKVTMPITSDVKITSSNPSVAAVTAAREITTLAAGKTTLTFTVGTGSAAVSTAYDLEVNDEKIVGLTINAQSLSVVVGGFLQCVALAEYSKGSKQYITDLVNWSSSNSVVAKIDSNLMRGMVTASSVGTTTIKAITETGISANLNLGVVCPITFMGAVVTPLIPGFDPAKVSIGAGSKQQFFALGAFRGGYFSDVTLNTSWKSKNPAVAIVDNSGLVKTISSGNTMVSAGVGGNSFSLNVINALDAKFSRVGVVLTESNPVLAMGTYASINAFGVIDEQKGIGCLITDLVKWSSSNASVVTIDSYDGRWRVTAKAPGQATITAKISVGGVNMEGSIEVNVTNATLKDMVVNSPGLGASIPVGAKILFQAIGVYSDNSLSDITEKVAVTSNNDNYLRIGGITRAGYREAVAVEAGNVDIAVSGDNGIIKHVKLTVVDPQCKAGVEVQTPKVNAVRALFNSNIELKAANQPDSLICLDGKCSSSKVN